MIFFARQGESSLDFHPTKIPFSQHNCPFKVNEPYGSKKRLVRKGLLTLFEVGAFPDKATSCQQVHVFSNLKVEQECCQVACQQQSL